ncbi:type II secretion system secretin GspD [Sulfitobacter sp. F26204]|uniref:type II secretion system secretin GspD n=1 Tax=Sulfitobacter sp. F26204 TaxID=2996014 RepID=UPI00225DF856|nr:type II secretion system secretin GspD [Sulfitobacter sp. F26204]MCX7560532.1 type II secretion system secretin GspD [Sulfitobacter sp. F26204]
METRKICRFVAHLLLLAWLLPTALAAQLAPLNDTDADFTINLRNAEISVLAEQVSEITQRTLVINPGLTGDVTVISAQPLTQAGVWSLFQSMLRVRGFVAVEAGVIWEIVPETQSIAKGGTTPPGGRGGDQDVITKLVPLDRLPSAEAVRVLRPLVAQTGYIEALTDPNAIIITDTQANVDRIVNIARTFDTPEEQRTEVIRFNFAEADTVAQAMSDVLGTSGTGARISVDTASNLLLVRGTERDISQIRQLARDLDVAPRNNPQVEKRTHLYALKFGDAEIVAEIVANTLQGGTDIVNPVADAVEGEGAPLPSGPAPEVSVQASTETNSIVIRGTARQIQEASNLIAALDQRPAQVMIEAAIVEVSGEVAERLGVQLGLGDNIPRGGIAATSFSNGGTSLGNVLSALGVSQAAGLASGLTLGGSADNFGILVQALSQSTQANLLSTPSITTTDNKPATIVVGQNVPFRTGSFATDGNTATPFTTIERRDVGITMQVLPRVTSNGIVRLDISQEVSSLVDANVEGAADLITNRRVIETTVQAQDGGTVVLGGLITDDNSSVNGKVPGLGDAPIIGGLFRSRSKNQTRRTLFVFMRPTVIDSQHKASTVARRQFQKIRKADASEPPRSLLKERKVERLPLEINGLY